MSDAAHLVIRFRATVSLPDGPRRISRGAREPEIHLAIDQSSPSPAQQTCSA